jgi:hypothetical protein
MGPEAACMGSYKVRQKPTGQKLKARTLGGTVRNACQAGQTLIHSVDQGKDREITGTRLRISMLKENQGRESGQTPMPPGSHLVMHIVAQCHTDRLVVSTIETHARNRRRRRRIFRHTPAEQARCLLNVAWRCACFYDVQQGRYRSAGSNLRFAHTWGLSSPT